MANRNINTILNLKDRFSKPLKGAAGNTKGFTKQAKLATYQVKNLGSTAVNSFKSMAKAAVGIFAVNKIKEFSVKLVQGAATVQAVSAQFSQVFGDMGGKAQDVLNSMGKDFGMVSSRLKPAFTTMTSMFKGLGLSTTDAIKQSQNAVTLAADAAAFYDKSYEDANAALNSFIKGNYEGGETIGLFANETQLASWASKALKKDWKKLDEAGKQVARLEYAKAMQKAAGATGQAARESDSLENQLGNFKATLEGLKSKLGGPLLNPAIQSIKALTNWISKINTDKIIDGINLMAKKVGEVSKASLPTLKNAVELVRQPIIDTIDIAIAGYGIIKDKWSTIKPLVLGVAIAFGIYKASILGVLAAQEAHNVILLISAFRSGGLAAAQTALAATQGSATIAQRALNAAMAANPIGLIITAIGLLIGAGILLYQNWDTVKAKAFELWEGIKTAFAPVADFFNGIWEGVKGGFKAFINFFIDGINKVTSGLNAIKIDIPDWVPKVGGQKWGLSIPQIPRFAMGTPYFKGGLAQINERGGEIVNLPNGSSVIPADKSEKIINNSSKNQAINIHIHGNVYGEADLINKVGNAISKRVQMAYANM